jgi:thiamine pyrophosphate-dependent acetolactate synthase large subunit-like protein
MEKSMAGSIRAVRRAKQDRAPQLRKAGRGADVIVETLIELGVTKAFNVIGLGMYDLGDAFYERRSQIDYVSHLNETNLALMAQGYARSTGKPAFCFLYYASGTALALASLVTAWADRAPMVFVSIANTKRAGGRDQYAAVPRSVLEMGEQFSKFSYEIPSIERIPEFLAKAYAIAGQPPMGPVHLSIPADLLAETTGSARQVANFSRTSKFADACADEAGLAAAATLLAGASKPILLVGSEVGQLGATEEMVALAELLGAPMMVENMASYLGVPSSHPQYIGSFGANEEARRSADVALAVGVEFTELGRPDDLEPLAPSTKLICMSVDDRLPTRQLWPDIALNGHPRASLAKLRELVAKQGVGLKRKTASLARCALARRRREEFKNKVAQMDRGASPVPPEVLTDEVARFCGQNWTFVNSGTSIAPLADILFELDDPKDFHQLSGKGSCQGWGAPVAIGVQLAQPSRRVMAIVGDGNLMFTGTSIWGAARNSLPIVFVVVNNGGWAHIPDVMREVTAGNDTASMGWTFEEAPIDYVKFAQSMGLEAALATTGEELAKHLRKAGASERPWLIEVRTARRGGMPPMVNLLSERRGGA